MRVITVAAAQMGPIQRAESRQAVIPRMIALMDEARGQGARGRSDCLSGVGADHVFPALVYGGPGRGR